MYFILILSFFLGYFFTLIFLHANSLALRSATEILMCRDYELRNRHAPRPLHCILLSLPTLPAQLFTCILMRCHPYFSLYARVPYRELFMTPSPPSRHQPAAIKSLSILPPPIHPAASVQPHRTEIHFGSRVTTLLNKILYYYWFRNAEKMKTRKKNKRRVRRRSGRKSDYQPDRPATPIAVYNYIHDRLDVRCIDSSETFRSLTLRMMN